MRSSKNEFSPQAYARAGGITYLIIIVAGIFGEIFVRNATVVSGNAVGTANNILASPLLWRLGIAGDLVMHICDVILMMILYVLLKPVNRQLALLALLFNLVQTSVLVANKLNLLLPLFLLGDADYLKAFEPNQLQAFSYIAIKGHAYGFGLGLIFFGFECLVVGYLILRSVFLPRLIGALMQVAGLCYIINSFTLIIDPNLANKLFPVILIPPFVGELSLCLWL
ncbi:MAG TPA: DUF4386 domain-containing protein, partial [Puia sp.]|nr:DUF4386 domain-containing protein [Puia sp.]